MRLKDLQDPAAMERVGAAIDRAVTLSFVEDRSRSTDDEVKRRTNICIEHFKIMRNDMKWSIAKICDLLEQSLRAELDAKNPADFINAMAKRGWVRVERQTEAGLIIPR